MDEDFQQFLSGKIERIRRGTDPLLESAHEILRRLITQMQAGDLSAFHSYASILKVLVEQRLAPDGIRPEWSQTFSNWVTESATKASRRNVRTADDLLGQLTDQLDHLVSGLRSLENLQTRITRTKPPIGSGLITGLAKLPKSMISGDFIDIFGEGAWTWIVLGDAAGHGLPAAYYANTIFPVQRTSSCPSVFAAVASAEHYSSGWRNW